MNVRLLRKIQKHILAEPKRYNQNVTIETDQDEIRDVNGGVPKCGTMACIGGWAYILSRVRPNLDFTFDHLGKARRELKITDEQADRLFDSVASGCTNYWPKKYADAYLKAKTPAGRARAAARRIDHFIKTKGAE